MTLRSTFPLRSRLLALLTLLTAAVPLWAAPRDELLRLVPEDVGFCLVLQDLRGHIHAVSASPLLEQFRNAAAVKVFRESRDFQNFVRTEEDLGKNLGVSGQQLLDEIFGDAVVLAYRPSADGKPESEQGIFLLHARDPKLLADLIERINTAQKKSGELKELETRKHQGVTYNVRVEERSTHYYYVNGSVLAYTSQEPMLKRVIELDGASKKQEPALAQRMRELGVHQAMMTWWVNPRAFDADLDRKIKQAKPAERHGLERFKAHWAALDGVACTLTPRKSDLEVGVAFLAREEKLPAPARKFLSGENRASELWGRFPADAMLTVAGKIDFAALAEFVGDFLPGEEQRKLKAAADKFLGAPADLNVAQDVLPNLGPDWGFCVLAPSAKQKSPLPLMLAALRVQPGNKEKPVDRAFFDALNLLANLAVFAFPDPLKLKSVHQDKVEVKYLHCEKGAAAGLEPAYALKDGYLLIASTPAAVLSFGSASKSVASDSNDCPLLRLSFRQLRTYLKEREDQLAEAIAKNHQIKADEAKRRLRALGDGCQYFDRLELSRRTAPGQVALFIRLHTEQPLRK